MKTLLSLALLASCAFAQEGYHGHDGFFLSMNVGPAFGPIKLDASGGPFEEIKYSGPGVLLDLKIGGTIRKTVSLSFDILSRTISNPEVEVDGQKVSTQGDFNANDVTLGLGVTYYIMPVNIFLSGTIGTATIQLTDGDGDQQATSERGIGFQLKAGKEWWVGRNWGLGAAAGFGMVSAKDKEDPTFPSYSGDLSSGRFFLMFNTTYN